MREWMNEALCADADDPDIWFPDTEEDYHKRQEKKRLAIVICSSCPVREPCLELGLEFENRSLGIFGGMHAKDRMSLARRRQRDIRNSR
jgi:WhiB family redox-sensing transcriptional regulator